MIYSKFDEEVFNNDPEQATPIIWWLINLLGGKVVMPIDEQFWIDNNYPTDAMVLLTKEDGQLVLRSTTLEKRFDDVSNDNG